MEVRKLEQTEKVVDYICDICNQSAAKGKKELYGLDDDECTWEIATLSATWGYWSDGKDLSSSECHMCESCYEKVKNFIENELKGKVRQLRWRWGSGPVDNKDMKEGTDYIIKE